MRIAFASCGSSAGYQPIWGVIKRQNPDLLLLLGDNVYIGCDGYQFGCEEDYVPGEIVQRTPFDVVESNLENKYDKLWKEVHFRDLCTTVPYLAIWDNHDFGLPGDKYMKEHPEVHARVIKYGAEVEWEHKKIMLKLFYKHMALRSLRPRLPELIITPESSIYCSYTDDTGKIKFIMLDVRSAQEDPDKEGPAAKLMDDDQLVWLRREIMESTAEIHIICSGLTLTLGNGNLNGCAKHINWSREFRRLVARSGKKTLFLGGSIHRNRFKQHKLSDPPGFFTRIWDWLGMSSSQYLYEVISSGVGRNFDVEREEEEMPDEDEGEMRRGISRNNYGVIDITDTIIKISLYGQARTDMHYIEIKRDDWKLKTFRSLG